MAVGGLVPGDHPGAHRSAIDGRGDNLVGLKENIIIGKLIPAGTGMPRYREFDVDAPDYQPMAFYSSDDQADPADWLARISGSYGDGDDSRPPGDRRSPPKAEDRLPATSVRLTLPCPRGRDVAERSLSARESQPVAQCRQTVGRLPKIGPKALGMVHRSDAPRRADTPSAT